MPKEAVFTLKLEAELRDQFMAEAEASHRPASQIMRDLMRDYVHHQRQARDHDSRFQAAIQAGLAALDSPDAPRIPNDAVTNERRAWRKALLQRAGKRPE